MCSVASPLPIAGASLGSGIALSCQVSLACLNLDHFHSLPLLFHDTGICELSLCPSNRPFSSGACPMLPRDQVEIIGSRVEYCRRDVCSSQGHLEGGVSICPSLCSLSHGDVHSPLYSYHCPCRFAANEQSVGEKCCECCKYSVLHQRFSTDLAFIDDSCLIQSLPWCLYHDFPASTLFPYLPASSQHPSVGKSIIFSLFSMHVCIYLFVIGVDSWVPIFSSAS